MAGVRSRIRRAERRIREAGFEVRYVDYCEDASTPGLLGYYRGVTDWRSRQVKVGLVAAPTLDDRAEVLEHELRHVLDPSWDCGSRPVLAVG